VSSREATKTERAKRATEEMRIMKDQERAGARDSDRGGAQSTARRKPLIRLAAEATIVLVLAVFCVLVAGEAYIHLRSEWDRRIAPPCVCDGDRRGGDLAEP
jgi:uncharacterized protein (DUF2345 family)